MRQKSVLICAPLLPQFDREGGSKRTFDLTVFLRQAGWSVSFLAENGKDGQAYAQMLQQRGIATYCGWAGRFEQLLRLHRFDLVVFTFWYIAEMGIPVVRRVSPATKVIVDTVDLHFVRRSRQAFLESGSTPTGAAVQAGPLDSTFGVEMVREINGYGAADAVLTVSQKEADLINDLVAGRTLAHTVPDTEDLPLSPVPYEQRKGILFIGNFRHPPNVDALNFLLNRLVPRLDPQLLEEHPVYVVGNWLAETMARMSPGAGVARGIRLVGWVPSVLPYLHHCRISVIPLLYGAGTKRKLVQACMTGTPSVSTSIGTEGLGLHDEQQVLIADGAERFAAAITRLLKDRALWQRLADSGRELVLGLHGPDVVRQRWLHVVDHVMEQ